MMTTDQILLAYLALSRRDQMVVDAELRRILTDRRDDGRLVMAVDDAIDAIGKALVMADRDCISRK